MTVTAQASAPPRPRTVPDASGRSRAIPAATPAAPARRRQVPLAPMRRETARSMRALAAQVSRATRTSPSTSTCATRRGLWKTGSEEGAQRHLRAAMHALTPLSLHRQGIHDDDGHLSAATALHGVNRHLLLTRDIADAAAANQAAIERDSYGDDSTAPARRDPNAGYGPGANAQKPTARQPPGDQALNAPDRTSAGRPDANVASPDSPQRRGSKQFSYDWGDLAAPSARSTFPRARRCWRRPPHRGEGPADQDCTGYTETSTAPTCSRSLRP